MKFFETHSVLLVLVVLTGVYCTNNLDSVSVEIEESKLHYLELISKSYI